MDNDWTHMTNQGLFCLYQSNTAISKHNSTFIQLHAMWDTFTEVSFYSFKKNPKLNQNIPIFKTIDLFK